MLVSIVIINLKTYLPIRLKNLVVFNYSLLWLRSLITHWSSFVPWINNDTSVTRPTVTYASEARVLNKDGKEKCSWESSGEDRQIRSDIEEQTQHHQWIREINKAHYEDRRLSHLKIISQINQTFVSTSKNICYYSHK